VPYIRPIPLFGNYLNVALGIEHPTQTYRQIYHELAGFKYGGMFQMRTPYLMIRDPELINNILIKDFSYFTDRGVHVDYSYEPLSEVLFFMENPRWKTLRNKLSPSFTSGKLKQMYSQMEECGHELINNIFAQLKKNPNEIDIRDILGDYATNVISTCAFGLKLDATKDDGASSFRTYGKTIFGPTIFYFLREILLMISPAILKIVRLPFFPHSATSFFGSVFRETMMYRKKNNIVRQDIVHALMQAHQDLVVNNSVSKDGKNFCLKIEITIFIIFNNRITIITFILFLERLTETQIIANAFGLFAAGFETLSSSLAYCLYELALKKNIQDRVREEINLTKSKHNGVIDHDFLNDLNYLDMVIAGNS